MPGRAYRTKPKGRRARCSGCGAEWTVYTRAGPVPGMCAGCNPSAAASRESERRRYAPREHPGEAKLRARHAAARRRVNTLEVARWRISRQRDKARAEVERLGAEVQRLGGVVAALTQQRDRLAEELRQARQAPVPLVRGGEPSERAVFDEVETHARKLGPPGADAVKVALVRLRHAEGASGTAAAAEDLAAALICWARVLRSPGDQIEAQRARHAA